MYVLYVSVDFKSVKFRWNLNDEWTNSLLVDKTDLYYSPYETILSRRTLLYIYLYIYWIKKQIILD